MVPLEKCMPGSVEKSVAKTDAKVEETRTENGANGIGETNGHAQPAPVAAPPQLRAPPQPLQQQRPASWSNIALFLLIAIAGLITARVVARLSEEL
jgi:hypothetical protein